MNKIKTLAIGAMMVIAGNIQASGHNDSNGGGYQNKYLAQSCVKDLSAQRPDEAKAVIQDICNIISRPTIQ